VGHDYFQIEEQCDFARGRLQRKLQSRGISDASWSESVFALAGGTAATGRDGKLAAAPPSPRADAEARLALGPERVLAGALAARDPSNGRDLVLQGGVLYPRQ
jgi:hypothetical protein